MGILLNLYTKCLNSYKKRKLKEKRHFDNIKNGLNESMHKTNETLDDIENWEELLNLEEESIENRTKNKIIKIECKDYVGCLDIFGNLFCLLHLFGVQEGIIILNALFDEIVDEMLLLVKDTPRQYNFYEYIEICSYKEIPEIDVAMITSSIGIIVLKKFGFFCSNFIFQLFSIIYFCLFFLLFDFHTNDQLLKNYTPLEIVSLIISYVFLSILVGCSSILALKEYWDFYSEVYFKKNKNNLPIEKIIFYFFPGLALFIVILINRKIFTSFKDITSKWVLMTIIFIYIGTFILSNLFYCLYMIPIKNKEKENQIKLIEQFENNQNCKYNDITETETKTNIIVKETNEIVINKQKIKNENAQNVKESENNEILKEEIEKKDENTQTDSKEKSSESNSENRKIELDETDYIKYNNSYPRIKNHIKEYRIKEIKMGKKTKIKINSQKLVLYVVIYSFNKQ